MPNSTYFNYTTSGGCYKVTGCKYPYIDWPRDGAREAEIVATYEPQDYGCYIEYFTITLHNKVVQGKTDSYYLLYSKVRAITGSSNEEVDSRVEIFNQYNDACGMGELDRCYIGSPSINDVETKTATKTFKNGTKVQFTFGYIPVFVDDNDFPSDSVDPTVFGTYGNNGYNSSPVAIGMTMISNESTMTIDVNYDIYPYANFIGECDASTDYVLSYGKCCKNDKFNNYVCE